MNSNETGNISSISIPKILHSLRFWYFLIFNLLSLGYSLITLYCLLVDRILRRALYNHICILLLCIGILYELIDISWFLCNNYSDTIWKASKSFYLFWTFFDYSIYSLQIGLFAWASLERHILIFHNRWLLTRKKRFFIHYLPIILIIIYYLIYYSLVYFGKSCDRSFENFLNGGIYAPCAFYRVTLGVWDLIVHQIIPTLIIIISCIILIIRFIQQKIHIRQLIHWRKYRKMTIQLLLISIMYMLFNSPWIILLLAYRFGLSENLVLSNIIYTKFLLYNITFLFPFVCCLSLPELRIKVKEKIFFCQRQRQIGVIF